MTRRLVHLSDLHFGRIRPELVGALVNTLATLAPDLVVTSGDFTQRARRAQFRAARAFVSRIDAPVLAVPGNHDVPLDNVALRLLQPFGRYRRFIRAELEPRHLDDEIDVIGVNTVNPMFWQRGHLRRHAVDRVCDALGEGDRQRMGIVALHHPLAHQPGAGKTPARGARRAAAQLAGCGADIVLSGHLHAGRVDPHTARQGGRATLLVQAGTALSTRLRGQENDFNLLTVEGDLVTIESYSAGARPVFARREAHAFRRDGNDWRRIANPET